MVDVPGTSAVSSHSTSLDNLDVDMECASSVGGASGLTRHSRGEHYYTELR